jgi:hypothetical protein
MALKAALFDLLALLPAPGPRVFTQYQWSFEMRSRFLAIPIQKYNQARALLASSLAYDFFRFVS